LSESAAPWLPLTWPRGLDDLLKAKARLWWIVSLVLIAPLLLLTAARFPSEVWKLALVGLGWGVFGKGLAERSITLVSVTSSEHLTMSDMTVRYWLACMYGAALGAAALCYQHVLTTGSTSRRTRTSMRSATRAIERCFRPWARATRRGIPIPRLALPCARPRAGPRTCDLGQASSPFITERCRGCR
jgi:hypothetical protein